MSEPLHLKYRPKTFDEIVGNSSTIQGIKNLLREKNVKTFLLHGQRGCGKTTIARIMANELGAKSERDIIELDLAEVGLKDKARELKHTTRYGSLSGGARVYIADEIQDSSKSFQEGMLKLLEEPPNNTYFILCTTNPEKLIKPVRSRCSTWQVNLLPLEQAEALVTDICKKERIRLSSKDKRLICSKTDGCPREILILLEAIKNVEGKEEKTEILNNFYSGVENAQIIELCRAIAKKQPWKEIAKMLKSIKDEPEQVRYAVLGYFATVLLNSGDGYASWVIDCFDESFMYKGRAGLVNACYQAVIIME